MVTIQTRLRDGLTKYGEKEVKRLKGCIVFTRQDGGFFYLGKAGSFRYGATRTASIPVSDRFKKMILNIDLMMA